MEEKLRKTVSLPTIIQSIASTLDSYEDGVFNEQELQEILGDLKVDLKASVDKRISFFDYIGKRSTGKTPGSGIIGKCEELYRTYREAMERAIALREKVEESTLEIIYQNPEVKFEGDLGKLASQKNSTSKLDVDIPLMQKTLSNVLQVAQDDANILGVQNVMAPRGAAISVEQIQEMNWISYTPQNIQNGGKPEPLQLSGLSSLIPDEYITTITVKQLNTQKLKEDLEAGKEITWAKTERGNHLRVRR